MGARRTLVVMARWPVSGRCKSRLAAELGPVRAAAIQGWLTAHTLAVARALRRWGAALGCDRVVCQGRGGLGLRLQRIVGGGLRRSGRRLVVIGSDLPGLGSADLLQAFAALERHELVLGPAQDGGYWLIGLRRSRPELFCGIDWGGPGVLGQTEEAAAGLGLVAHRLAWRADLDRPADLAPWR